MSKGMSMSCQILATHTGYGLKSPKARMQPLTRGLEADETKTKTVALPQHACVLLSGAR